VIYNVNAALIIASANDILHVLVINKIIAKNERVADGSKRESEHLVESDYIILFQQLSDLNPTVIIIICDPKEARQNNKQF
jgi:hypothetical protein